MAVVGHMAHSNKTPCTIALWQKNYSDWFCHIIIKTDKRNPSNRCEKELHPILESKLQTEREEAETDLSQENNIKLQEKKANFLKLNWN